MNYVIMCLILCVRSTLSSRQPTQTIMTRPSQSQGPGIWTKVVLGGVGGSWWDEASNLRVKIKVLILILSTRPDLANAIISYFIIAIIFFKE